MAFEGGQQLGAHRRARTRGAALHRGRACGVMVRARRPLTDRWAMLRSSALLDVAARARGHRLRARDARRARRVHRGPHLEPRRRAHRVLRVARRRDRAGVAPARGWVPRGAGSRRSSRWPSSRSDCGTRRARSAATRPARCRSPRRCSRWCTGSSRRCRTTRPCSSCPVIPYPEYRAADRTRLRLRGAAALSLVDRPALELRRHQGPSRGRLADQGRLGRPGTPSLAGLVGLGFDGILLDTWVYDDGGAAAVAALQPVLGEPIDHRRARRAASGSGIYADIRPRAGLSDADVRDAARRLVGPTLLARLPARTG